MVLSEIYRTPRVPLGQKQNFHDVAGIGTHYSRDRKLSQRLAVRSCETWRKQGFMQAVNNRAQWEEIRRLFTLAESRGIYLWLQSGWAIDARLNRITREHEDIDVAFAAEKEKEFEELLGACGYSGKEETDYGFLIRKGNILLDAERCFRFKNEYDLQDSPAGSCPLEKEGCLEGYPVRCVTWKAIYFEYLYYMDETPLSQWRPKDFASLKIVEQNLTPDQIDYLKQVYYGKK